MARHKPYNDTALTGQEAEEGGEEEEEEKEGGELEDKGKDNVRAHMHVESTAVLISHDMLD